MLKSYQRRAFLLCLVVTAEPAGVAVARAGQTPGAGLTAYAADTANPLLPTSVLETGGFVMPVRTADMPLAMADTTNPLLPASALEIGGFAVPARSADTTLAMTGSLAPEPETLWDVMSRIDRNANAAAAAAAAGPARLPLGTIPGFTVPANPKAKFVIAALKQKKKRANSFGMLGNWFDQFERSTHSTFKSQGQASLTLRQDNISGGTNAAQAFQQDNYMGQGGNGIYTNANLHIDATLFDSLHYSTDINNSQYSQPNSNVFKLEYKTKTTEAQFGDISASFQGNSLIDFNRYVSGVEMTNHWTKMLQTTVLISQTKATPQTRVIPGNNSSGPYFVFSGQIVPGSVSVRVDNADKQEGKDYTLDPVSGQLNFLNGYIVLQTSSIAVTYETLDSGQSSGGVYGIRTALMPKSGESFGITYVVEQANGSQNPTQQKQQFQGNLSPLSAYPLNYPINLNQPYTVTVNGAPQTPNVDYKIDTVNLNQFFMLQGLNSTSIVEITYYPLNTDPNPGNRSVLGLDGKLPLGHIGSMTLESAFSGLSITGQNIGGQAMQVKFNLTPTKSLRTDITLKDIGPSFSSIQSPGFNQNEKSITLNSEYTPIKSLRLSMSWEEAKRPDYASTTSTGSSQYTVNTNGNDTYNQYSLGAAWTFAKNATLNLSRNSFGTTFIVGGKSTSTNDMLSVNYTLGKVGLNAGITTNSSFSDSIESLVGLTSSTTAGSNYATSSDTFSKHAGITWNPAHWLHLTANFSDNDITNSGAGVTTVNNGTGLLAHSDARETDLSSTFDLSKKLKIQYSLALSDTGDLSPTTTTTGTTTGSTTTGSTTTGTTSTGSTSTGITSSGTSVSRAFAQFFAPWQLPTGPTRDTTTTATTSSTSSIFGGGTNSGLGSTGSYGGGLGNTYGSTYEGASIGGRTLNNRFNITYAPTAKLHTTLGLDQSSSVGDYLYNSNRNSVTAGMDYALSSRMRFNVNYNVQSVNYTGGLGNTDTHTITVDFEGKPFGRKLNMRVGWQSVRNYSLLNQTALTSGTTTSTTGTTGTTGSSDLLNTSTNLGSYLFHVDYPVGNRISVFLDLLDSITTGYEGTSQGNTRFGLDYGITQVLKFSLGWQLTNQVYQDVANSSLNYRTSSLLAQFGLRF